MSQAELESLAREVGKGLQRLQDELGRDGRGHKVRFPRGYIRPMGELENFWWINSHAVRSNLQYHLIFGDVLRWLLNRTDLYGVARGMVIKHVIVLSATICETLLKKAMTQSGHGKGKKFPAMLKQLQIDDMISGESAHEMEWLWGIRANIHVYEVENPEHDAYQVAQSNRAIRAYQKLERELSDGFLQTEFEVLS